MKVVSLIAKTQNRLICGLFCHWEEINRWWLIYLHQSGMAVIVNWGTAVFYIYPSPPTFKKKTCCDYLLNKHTPVTVMIKLCTNHPFAHNDIHFFWQYDILQVQKQIFKNGFLQKPWCLTWNLFWDFPANYSTYIVMIYVKWISWFRKVKRPKKLTKSIEFSVKSCARKYHVQCRWCSF